MWKSWGYSKTVNVTQKELLGQNDPTNVSNDSESGLVIDDSPDIESYTKTQMASIPDSQSVSEPSVLEMRGTSITDSIQIESREIESQLNGIPKNKCKFFIWHSISRDSVCSFLFSLMFTKNLRKHIFLFYHRIFQPKFTQKNSLRVSSVTKKIKG